MESRKMRRGLLRMAYWSAAVVLIYAGLRYALPCILPLVLGAALAALLHPLASGLCEKTGFRYRPCALLVAVVTLAALCLLLWGIGTLLLSQGSALFSRLPTLLQHDILPMLEGLWGKCQTALAGLIPQEAGRSASGWQDALKGALTQAVTELSGRVVAGLGELVGALPQLLLTCSFTVLSAILFLQDYRGITGSITRLLPGAVLRPVVESKRFLLERVRRVLLAYLCIMMLTFAEISLGLLLLGVPYFAVIGFFIALLDILPFIGSGLFLIPWGLYEWLLMNHAPLGIGLLLLYAVVAAVRFWVEPRIVGGRIGLHPLATLTAMYAGLRLFGFWGLLFAPLFTTLVLHLVQSGMMREGQ